MACNKVGQHVCASGHAQTRPNPHMCRHFTFSALICNALATPRCATSDTQSPTLRPGHPLSMRRCCSFGSSAGLSICSTCRVMRQPARHGVLDMCQCVWFVPFAQRPQTECQRSRVLSWLDELAPTYVATSTVPATAEQRLAAFVQPVDLRGEQLKHQGSGTT